MWNYVYPSYELYHHGIFGMHWGKKNGPPYPLDPSDHSASEKKAGWRRSLDNGGGSENRSYKKLNRKRSKLERKRSKLEYKQSKLEYKNAKKQYRNNKKELSRNSKVKNVLKKFGISAAVAGSGYLYLKNRKKIDSLTADVMKNVNRLQRDTYRSAKDYYNKIRANRDLNKLFKPDEAFKYMRNNSKKIY